MNSQVEGGDFAPPWETIYKNGTKFFTVPPVLVYGLIKDFN
jgi:hypothetical protein